MCYLLCFANLQLCISFAICYAKSTFWPIGAWISTNSLWPLSFRKRSRRRASVVPRLQVDVSTCYDVITRWRHIIVCYGPFILCLQRGVPMTRTIWRGKVGTHHFHVCNAFEPTTSVPITSIYCTQKKQTLQPILLPYLKNKIADFSYIFLFPPREWDTGRFMTKIMTCSDVSDTAYRNVWVPYRNSVGSKRYHLEFSYRCWQAILRYHLGHTMLHFSRSEEIV